MGKIYIIDVTNRDGVQTAKLGLSKLEKTIINLYLNEMGVFQSECGFPTTRHEQLYLQANIELAKMGILSPIRLSGWVRAVVEDVELTFKRVPRIKHLNLSISTSDQMISGKFRGKRTLDDVIAAMTEAVDAARFPWSKVNRSKCRGCLTDRPETAGKIRRGCQGPRGRPFSLLRHPGLR